MLEHKERDQGLYDELISLCRETSNFELATRIFVAMESVGLKPTSDIFNSLISVSMSVGNEMTALSLFEVMDRSEDYKPNSKTYNAFIAVYAKVGNVKAMKAWASAKKAAGFAPDLQSYEPLILGCVRTKNFDIVESYFKEMMSSGFIPNMSILDNMVYGLCEQQDLGRVKEFLLYMIDNKWEVSAYMADRLSDLYSKLGKTEMIEELLQLLTASNASPEVLSRLHYGIIGMHAKADSLDDMEYAVGRMLKHGLSFKSDKDVNFVIRSYFRRGAYDRLELLLEHIKGSYEFKKSTLDLLITGYRVAGLSDKLEMLLKEFALDGIS